MQVSVETTQGLERKMTIAVPGDEVDTEVHKRLQEAARDVQLKGFRKGKVPFKVIKGRFGKGVRQEVVGELMSKNYYDAITQQSLKPASQPHIETTNTEEGQDLQFTATFEVYPEVELPDFSSIKVDNYSAEVTPDDVDKMIETLRSQRQTWEKVERAAALQDMVNIDYSGSRDGEKFDGGEAEGTNLVLGSERMIPGFEDGMVGKKDGDSFTLPLKFPEEYQTKELAGAEVEFEITVNSISEQRLPEVDAEFFTSFGVEEGGMEAFREEIASNMEREMKTASKSKLKTKIMDAVVDLVDIEIPQGLIDPEIQQLKNQAIQNFGGGAKVDASLLPDDMFTEQARKRVLLGLVLGEAVKQQNLSADADKVRESVEELASTYESPQEVINWYYSSEEQLATVEQSVLEDAVFDYIVDQAEISEQKVSYEEVIRPDSGPEPETSETEEAAAE